MTTSNQIKQIRGMKRQEECGSLSFHRLMNWKDVGMMTHPVRGVCQTQMNGWRKVNYKGKIKKNEN